MNIHHLQCILFIPGQQQCICTHMLDFEAFRYLMNWDKSQLSTCKVAAEAAVSMSAQKSHLDSPIGRIWHSMRFTRRQTRHCFFCGCSCPVCQGAECGRWVQCYCSDPQVRNPDCNPLWRWTEGTSPLTTIGPRGRGYTVAMDKILDILQSVLHKWIDHNYQDT